MKALIIILVHIIGAIIALVVHYKDGTFEWCSKNGDGIRFAVPSNVVFMDLVCWEILLLICFIDLIEKAINSYFSKKFDTEGGKKY